MGIHYQVAIITAKFLNQIIQFLIVLQKNNS